MIAFKHGALQATRFGPHKSFAWNRGVQDGDPQDFSCGSGNGKDPEMKVLGPPIQCDHCHTEIPVTVALSFEGADYIYHFCGPQCIAAWCKTTSAHDKL